MIRRLSIRGCLVKTSYPIVLILKLLNRNYMVQVTCCKFVQPVVCDLDSLGISIACVTILTSELLNV